jgi:hypothetical protein
MFPDSVSKPLLLPTEIIMNIAEYLEPGSVSSFRLCCRTFAAVGLPYLLRKKVMYIHTTSLLNLQELCKEQYRLLIHSLHFEIQALQAPPATFDKYVKKVFACSQLIADCDVLRTRYKDTIFVQPSLTRTRLKTAYDTDKCLFELQCVRFG